MSTKGGSITSFPGSPCARLGGSLGTMLGWVRGRWEGESSMVVSGLDV